MTSRTRILVVDDDDGIRDTLEQHLVVHGFDVIAARDGVEGFDRFSAARPDLVLSDLAMPRADGFALIQRIRATSETPIVVLSVRGGDVDKVRALDLGADDFVVKPFSAPELLARVRAQLRRSGAGHRGQIEFPDLSIDVEKRKVVQGGHEVKLTPTELAILDLLARHAGRPVSFDEIITAVWKGSAGTTNDAVRVHVGALRRKIEPDPSKPQYIVTEPWIGYRFIAEPVG
ncbi:MAG TPA: response regulator transcription factor [Thermoanaerobaculia bacterium]|jgi:two-component system KDP operon response regulator KdpE